MTLLTILLQQQGARRWMVKYNYDGGLSCYFLFLYDSSSDKKAKRDS